jgi:hypothetical protein
MSHARLVANVERYDTHRNAPVSGRGNAARAPRSSPAAGAPARRTRLTDLQLPLAEDLRQAVLPVLPDHTTG